MAVPTSYDEAVAWLDAHVNLEVLPAGSPGVARSLDRMRALVHALGDPQASYPVVHVTGTNGKGSTARMITSLLVAQGLSVGTYSSPHLERVNERLAWNGEAVDDDAFARSVAAVAGVEALAGGRASFFELLTAAAFTWFADVAVDVAVVEVGLGGRWDATNVADAAVAVVTNVAIDHVEYLGPTRRDIASVKAGIVKPGCHLVLGEDDGELDAVFTAAGPATTWRRTVDFACEDNVLAVGGRELTLRTPGATYPEVFLPLHGAHQGDNAAVALAATEAFFDTVLDPSVVAEGLGAVTVPGRLEVVGRYPLCVLDGAHNPAGAHALADALDEAFPADGRRVLVVGLLQGRDPLDMLEALDGRDAELVVACDAPSPRAVPAAEIAAAAESLGTAASVARSVPEAVARALAAAGDDGQVVVTGSLYVVGTARAALRAGLG